MTKYPRKVRVESTSMIWQRNDTGAWDRHLVRRLSNGVHYWSRLVYVPIGRHVCMHCLSTNVQLKESKTYESGELRCNDCGVFYGIV